MIAKFKLGRGQIHTIIFGCNLPNKSHSAAVLVCHGYIINKEQSWGVGGWINFFTEGTIKLESWSLYVVSGSLYYGKQCFSVVG